MNTNPTSWAGNSDLGFALFQEFKISGIWTKPQQGTYFYIECIGGGGGGGSGDRGVAGTLRNGGASANSGAYCSRFGLLSLLGATEIVTVGIGVTGASAITTDDTVGGAATTGGTSSFGSIIYAIGGGATIPFRGNSNFAYGYVGIAGNNVGNNTPYGPGGSGKGGSISAANATTNGSSGGQGFTVIRQVTTSSSGSGGAVNGGNGTGYGDSGGGGNSSNTANATNGGNGAFPGGAGGGGGASLNGFNSGAGGAGANGLVRIWTW